MRSFLIIAMIFLSACVSEPLPEGFKASDDFDPIAAAKNRISLGLTYLKNGNYSQAKFNLDKALKFAPRLADAHFSMAYYYQQVDEDKLADEAYQKALAFDPKNPDIANSYGAFLCENGQYTEAKSYFLKAVNSSNYISTAETYENLALCSQSQGEIEDALTYLQSSLNHQPSRAKALNLLVELQMQQQQWEEAKLNLRRLEKTARVTADTLWKSIIIEQALNHNDLAKGYGDMLISMYPKHPNTVKYIQNRQNLANLVDNKKVAKKLTPNKSGIDNINNQNTVAEQLNTSQNVNTDNSAQPQKNNQNSQENNQNSVVQDYPVEDSQPEEILKETSELESEQEVATLLKRQEVNEESVQKYHIVQKGENLYRISLKYNVKMQRLMDWNNLSDGAALFVGKKLIVIDPQAVENK
ncbi:type IV pilus biogenesis/stability protein PilW [Aliiglaciecola sp. 3_MG-2023]|uniref:type IV pilus biogenesis/stability protein PilW n=1 Tax=Aliiglaciecola sp. 3_MG-2023 TaxID=3062644 RepID=UPI0026E3367F|nr:type IV pilus biogenesis/stability protein PilW [Aliiglaciecola sp. 3_MG-2023]MDO6691815.1 type IV pilus biogenesis/stability protein PilW [Aliiglaciecola sp. 3_MG-2023]